MGRFEGMVALVTGAARGQGRSHALGLAAEGADILALDVPPEIEGLDYAQGYTTATPDQLDLLRKEVEALGRRVIAAEGDVREQRHLDDLVAQGISEFGKIDILVANAGVTTIGSFWEIGDEEWRSILDVNLGGVWRAAKAVAPHMIERASGTMVFTGSAASFEGTPHMAHYTASKHGILGLMKTVALELGPHNIRVNAVCPGVVDTDMLHWQGGYDFAAGGPGGTRETLYQGSRHWHLLGEGKILDPSAVTSAVLYLASDDAAQVTGIALPVDAGHLVVPGFIP